MVVFARRKGVHMCFGRERPLAGFGGPQVRCDRRRTAPVRQAQVDHRVRLGVQQVIAVVLGVAHAEPGVEVLGERMHLKREIPAPHGVQHVEPDRELGAESAPGQGAQQLARVLQHQILRRDFHVRH